MSRFELEYSLRNDTSFQKKVYKILKDYIRFETLSRTNSKYQPAKVRAFNDLLSVCHWNIALLAPYMFPKYDRGSPLSLKDHPFSVAMYTIMPHSVLTIRGSRQIGKTTSLTSRDVMVSQLLPGFKIFTICPKSQQIQTFANKYKETESHYVFHKKHTNYRNNLFFKEYPNKSTVKMVYCLTSASSVRGNSTDAMAIDECQDFDGSLELEVSEIQSASEYPLTTYSGTSLTTDSFLEAKWLDSSQGLWAMKCHSCNHYNYPVIEHKVLDMIQPDGVCCVKCGKPIDVRQGFWDHQSHAHLDAGLKGLHVPKIIVPSIVENPFKWNKIYIQSKNTANISKFFQEVLGIPTEEGEREITTQNLKDICTLGDLHSVQKKCRGYKHVVSGCDWGGSDYNAALRTKLSYTAHVIMGITHERKFEIIHMRKYSGMGFKDVALDIVSNHQQMMGFAMGSDAGVGAQYNEMLREHLPANTHFIFKYSGPATKVMQAVNSNLSNHYGLNRTESITALFEAIKTQRIRCYDWMLSKDYLLDILNMYRALDESPGGATTFRYIRAGNKSDDILHALNFAYTIGRIILGEPLVEDRSLQDHLNRTIYPDVDSPLNAGRHISG